VRKYLLPAVLIVASTARGDGPADNIPEKVRRIPPPGAKIPKGDREELEAGVAVLGKAIDSLRGSLRGKPSQLELLPDVEIYHKAVDWALRYDEIFNVKEVPTARMLLKQGLERANQLAAGKAPWTTATGLVVRGYRSRIDDSVQPYGLVVPASYQPNSVQRHRLDLWWHGRGETLSELNFIDQRQRNPGEFAPPNAFVLHPYGRYCNANKFAGEIDTFEAIEHAQRHYPINRNRIVARGFSMGGAACWQFATHYPDFWCAAAPGAGFSETPDFLKVFQKELVKPTDYEQTLWHWYDCTDYALNLFNLPTVAYSGENDRQKQAADVMASAMAKEGLNLVHIIGPKTEHRYHPDSKIEINRRIDAIAARDRDAVPRSIRFTTYTLRYHRCFWFTIDALDHHWQPARVEAEITDRHSIKLKLSNVAAYTISMPPGACPLDPVSAPIIYHSPEDKNGTVVESIPASDRSWTTHWRKSVENGRVRWREVVHPAIDELAKRHGLQGPIDDAFMSRFVMVRPTGKPLNETIGKWAAAEMAHAIEHWRRHFRGDAIVKDDSAITDADIATSNLVLWGDPQSNQILARIAPKLPIEWNNDGVRIGEARGPSPAHVPIMIYPNPLNPKKYVVLNSGFTFREYDHLNNARQVAKLPDWAIVDVSTPPSSRTPGKVVEAGFFGEQWEWQAKREPAPR
jgi:hypothetical protein